MAYSRRTMFKGMAGLLLTSALTACSGTGTTATISADTIQSYAQAADKLVENVINTTGFMSLFPATTQTEITNIETQISNTIASMSASAGKSVSVDVGKNWAKSLVSELQQLLEIAEPIAQQYSPKVATYLSLADSLITMIETVVGTISVRSVGTRPDANQVITKIYAGVGA